MSGVNESRPLPELIGGLASDISTLFRKELELAKAETSEKVGQVIGGVELLLGGAVLALYPRHLLAEDAKLANDGQGFDGITLAYNTCTRGEIDAVLAQAATAGARILKPAQDTFWGGYSGYFADPDGHLWEVAWNPEWELTTGGDVKLNYL